MFKVIRECDWNSNPNPLLFQITDCSSCRISCRRQRRCHCIIMAKQPLIQLECMGWWCMESQSRMECRSRMGCRSGLEFRWMVQWMEPNRKIRMVKLAWMVSTIEGNYITPTCCKDSRVITRHQSRTRMELTNHHKECLVKKITPDDHYDPCNTPCTSIKF